MYYTNNDYVNATLGYCAGCDNDFDHIGEANEYIYTSNLTLNGGMIEHPLSILTI